MQLNGILCADGSLWKRFSQNLRCCGGGSFFYRDRDNTAVGSAAGRSGDTANIVASTDLACVAGQRVAGFFAAVDCPNIRQLAGVSFIPKELKLRLVRGFGDATNVGLRPLLYGDACRNIQNLRRGGIVAHRNMAHLAGDIMVSIFQNTPDLRTIQFRFNPFKNEAECTVVQLLCSVAFAGISFPRLHSAANFGSVVGFAVPLDVPCGREVGTCGFDGINCNAIFGIIGALKLQVNDRTFLSGHGWNCQQATHQHHQK